jgi:secreted PhoX family phosphatase
LNGGSIYKFVPSSPRDLSDGQLYALRLTGLTDAEQVWNQATYSQKAGAFEWIPLDMGQAVVDADVASNAIHATEFGRPEDLEIIGKTLYVANTSEDRVIGIDLSKQVLSSYIEAGVNVPFEDAAAGVTGLNSPDNLAEGPDGALWVVEDNVPSDIFRAEKDKDHDGSADGVQLFASLVDPEAETTGIYFGKSPKELFVNIQHPAKPQADGTWMITPAK